MPTRAGAFAPGQETAPRALRAARLLHRLATAGFDVVDRGDGEVWRWRPDPDRRDAQNLDGLEFEVAMRALRALAADERVPARTITEINPLHGAPDGSTIDRFAAALTDSLVA